MNSMERARRKIEKEEGKEKEKEEEGSREVDAKDEGLKMIHSNHRNRTPSNECI